MPHRPVTRQLDPIGRELALALGIELANTSGAPRQEYPEVLMQLVRRWQH